MICKRSWCSLDVHSTLCTLLSTLDQLFFLSDTRCSSVAASQCQNIVCNVYLPLPFLVCLALTHLSAFFFCLFFVHTSLVCVFFFSLSGGLCFSLSSAQLCAFLSSPWPHFNSLFSLYFSHSFHFPFTLSSFAFWLSQNLILTLSLASILLFISLPPHLLYSFLSSHFSASFCFLFLWCQHSSLTLSSWI